MLLQDISKQEVSLNNKVRIAFPPTSAQSLGLAPAPDGCYTLTWLDLGVRLARLTANPVFADHQALERQLMSHHYGEIVADAIVTTWSDWQSLALETGLEQFHGEGVTEAQARAWFTWFFYHVFVPIYPELKARGVTDRDVAGYARCLSPEAVLGMAFEPISSCSNREADSTSSIFIQTLESYSQLLTPVEKAPEAVGECVVF